MKLQQRNIKMQKQTNKISFHMSDSENDRQRYISQNSKDMKTYQQEQQNNTLPDLQTETRTYLKALVQQKHPIKKLMISSILASLYIQQHNYQEAHQILTNIETTISKLEKYSQKNPIFSTQDYLDLQIIRIKMYANFILIAIINVQVQLFERYLEEALGSINDFLQGNKNYFNSKHKSLSVKNQSSQNFNPNMQNDGQLSRQQSIQFAIMLFKLLLKSFSGYQSFQQIQAQTLIAQCQTNNNQNYQIESFFYFSNISFLKLLSTSDYQSAYKLEVHAYDSLESFIQKNDHQIGLREVILKTVSLKKLMFLAEQLKLPTQIIKMYNQKLYSAESLQSQYLQGLQENTIFRNYNEKINLGFRLITLLKEFQKDYITPLEFSRHSRTRKFSQSQQNHSNKLQLWQCKALKNRFIQLLTSKSLQSNERVKQNIILLVDILNSMIGKQSSQGNGSQEMTNHISVEYNLLLQSIGCLKQKSQYLKNVKKPQSMSLYESAVLEYKNRLEIFCSSLNQKLILPLYGNTFQLLEQNEQPQISVQVYQDKDNTPKNDGQQQYSESDSEPSIYLQDVQFEVIDQGQKKQNKPHSNLDGKKQPHKAIPSIEPNKHFPQKQKIHLSTQKQASMYRKVDMQKHLKSPQNQTYESRTSKSPRKNIYLNQKNQVYVNYAEIGSRVKLNHLKPSGKQQIQPKYQTSHHEIKKDSVKNQRKVHHFQESIKKQGQIDTPNQQSIVKLVGKKYPFQDKQTNRLSPLSLVPQNKYQKIDSIFYKFKQQNKYSYDSKITQRVDEQKSVQQRSLSKSRNKKSSLSPKVPKDSTINSKLNEHIKKHELTYSPESRVSGIKSKKIQKSDRQDQLSSYSANLSPSEKSRSKVKPKVQKASSYIKSPSNSAINIHNKTIKFKEYMDNLQKSGVNINQPQTKSKQTSKPKVQSKVSHRRIVTQANQSTQQNYQSYISGKTSKFKQNQANSGILQGFLAEPAYQAYKSMLKNSPSNQLLSQEKQNRKQQKSSFLKPKRTGSELVFLQKQDQMQKNENLTQQAKMKENQSKVPVKQQNQQIKITRSQFVNKQTIQNSMVSPISSMISPQMMGNYVLKMIKSHKAKLNHSIKLCQNGQYVDKKHYSSDGGDQRFLQLSLDHKNLQWAVTESKLLEGNKTKYQLKNIKGVVFGQVTETMRKGSNKNLQPYKCISFIFQKRTFDIYLTEQNDSKFWLPGISYCVSQSKPQLNHPNYTKKIQKFIKMRENPIKKDDLHSNTVYYSLGRVLWKRILLKMQQKYLNKSKKTQNYKNANAGAIIEFKKSLVNKEKQSRVSPMLPPTGKQSKMSKDKSITQQSRINER